MKKKQVERWTQCPVTIEVKADIVGYDWREDLMTLAPTADPTLRLRAHYYKDYENLGDADRAIRTAAELHNDVRENGRFGPLHFMCWRNVDGVLLIAAAIHESVVESWRELFSDAQIADADMLVTLA